MADFDRVSCGDEEATNRLLGFCNAEKNHLAEAAVAYLYNGGGCEGGLMLPVNYQHSDAYAEACYEWLLDQHARGNGLHIFLESFISRVFSSELIMSAPSNSCVMERNRDPFMP